MKKKIHNEHAGATNIDIGIMPFLKNNSNIESILDVGCGPGGNVKFCQKIGFKAYGIDGDYDTIPTEKNFQYVDYRISSSDFNRTFDLCWSVEFAEHIEEKFIKNFVKDYLKCKILIFTAAPIGWGGVGHVNEQNEIYWINKFKQYGLKLDKQATNEIRKISVLKFNDFVRAEKKQFVKNRGLLFVNTLFQNNIKSN